MALMELCTKENFAWSNGSIEGYWVDGLTILRRQIPLSPAVEARLMAEYGLGPDQRKDYYQTVAKAIQHEIAVTKRLKELGVKSTLTYIAVEQAKSADGALVICQSAEGQLTPLCQSILHGSVPAITILDIVSRLAIILRDLSQQGISHGNLSLDGIYLTEEQRILLGGWGYANGPEIPAAPEYAIDAPGALWAGQGAPGSVPSDMEVLSVIAWNLFCGLPGNTLRPPMPDVAPQYAPVPITAALAIGRSGDKTKLQDFRKALSLARREILQSGEANTQIPIAKAPEYFVFSQSI